MKKILLMLSLILAFLGFLDSTYLTILHFKHAFPPCSLVHTCEIVLTSKYAAIGPIPLALFGSLYYATVMLLAGILLQTNKTSEEKSFFSSCIEKLPIILFAVVTWGLLFSLYLLYLQAFILHAYCQYCLASEAICLGLWIVGILLLKTPSKQSA